MGYLKLIPTVWPADRVVCAFLHTLKQTQALSLVKSARSRRASASDRAWRNLRLIGPPQAMTFKA
jgi:hypothetical protein